MLSYRQSRKVSRLNTSDATEGRPQSMGLIVLGENPSAEASPAAKRAANQPGSWQGDSVGMICGHSEWSRAGLAVRLGRCLCQITGECRNANPSGLATQSE
jgi:hypothetical protein